MKKILSVILLSCVLMSCSSQVVKPNRIQVVQKVDTDSLFESIETHEVRRLAIQSKNKLRQAQRVYKENQFDCEDYVQHLKNEIMVYHTYEHTPLIYQVNIMLETGEIHAILGYRDSSYTERFYDTQNHQLVIKPKVIKRKY